MPLKSDPRRLPRRNHYQEGPGFLFVATQGGRPPGRRSTSSRRRSSGAGRGAPAVAEGEPLDAVCAEAAAVGRRLFRWRTRFEADGMAGLVDRPGRDRRASSRPSSSGSIITVRLLTYWNSRRIAAEFGRRGIDGQPRPGRPAARARTAPTGRALPGCPGPRYERTSPNELWHIDLKGPFYLRRAGGTAPDLPLRGPRRRPQPLPARASGRCPPRRRVPDPRDARPRRSSCAAIPLALMTDNGTPFVTIVRTMLSRFQRTLAELAIRHIRTQIDTPWTNGKIEAFWATLQAEVLDRQHLADLAAAEAAVTAYATLLQLPPAPWRSSAGTHRPSGSTAPRSPTAASSTSRRSPRRRPPRGPARGVSLISPGNFT